ncbi:MAG: ATP-binding protein [Thermomicrobiales bacterium]|nr:ATP-binding protein [Thermomicrobiales bacterium]
MSDQGIAIQEATIRLRVSMIHGSGVILSQDGAISGFSEAEISPAAADDIAQFQNDWAEGKQTLEIGTVKTTEMQTPARIDARGFNRHSFMCGQSGSGKTYSLGVVLEQLLVHTDLRIAVIDPNADYVQLNTPHASWQTDSSDANPILANYQRRVSDLNVLRSSTGGGLSIRFSDLSREDQAKTLRLDPLIDRDEFDAFWRMVDGLGDRPYLLRDVQEASASDLSVATRQVLLRISNLGVGDWGVWASEGEQSLPDFLDSDWRSVVMDVSRFERPIERSVIALATLRHFWANRESRNPVLLVIDEAHNVCPRDPVDPIQAAATELAIAIAGEGRKYGIYLLLSTQRPDKLHPNVVSQCDNLMLMRMNSHSDLEELQRIFSFVPEGILQESLAFRQGEALVAGKVVASPLLVRMGRRISAEGGADVATDWANVSSE